MISSQQYRKLMRSYRQTENVTTSALQAGLDRKTARKYLIEGSPGPEEPRPFRHWRTRPDAFAGIWPEVQEQLYQEPALEAKVLFEQVLEQHRGQFDPRQRRTFERRVRAWKRAHGPEAALFFTQEHLPGERLQLDSLPCQRVGSAHRRSRLGALAGARGVTLLQLGMGTGLL